MTSQAPLESPLSKLQVVLNCNDPQPCLCPKSESPQPEQDLDEGQSDTQSESSCDDNEKLSPNSPAESLSSSNSSTDLQLKSSNGKRNLEEDEDVVVSVSKRRCKKQVHFDGVTVYWFPRVQGFTCVPSQGGSTLGMQESHSSEARFTVDEFSRMKRLVHRRILLDQVSTGRLALPADKLAGLQSDEDADLGVDDYYFLQPVPIRQRRMILKQSGVKKIETTERDECREIRSSREVCGCDCEGVCHPDRCFCSRAGIQCQVDRVSFPCGCSEAGCSNPYGRIEFNPMRVRMHFVHTLLRMEQEPGLRDDMVTYTELQPATNCRTAQEALMQYSKDYASLEQKGLVTPEQCVLTEEEIEFTRVLTERQDIHPSDDEKEDAMAVKQIQAIPEHRDIVQAVQEPVRRRHVRFLLPEDDDEHLPTAPCNGESVDGVTYLANTRESAEQKLERKDTYTLLASACLKTNTTADEVDSNEEQDTAKLDEGQEKSSLIHAIPEVSDNLSPATSHEGCTFEEQDDKLPEAVVQKEISTRRGKSKKTQKTYKSAAKKNVRVSSLVANGRHGNLVNPVDGGDLLEHKQPVVMHNSYKAAVQHQGEGSEACRETNGAGCLSHDVEQDVSKKNGGSQLRAVNQMGPRIALGDGQEESISDLRAAVAKPSLCQVAEAIQENSSEELSTNSQAQLVLGENCGQPSITITSDLHPCVSKSESAWEEAEGQAAVETAC